MYNFKEQDAFDFARHVHAQTNVRNDELFFKLCPYCNPKPTRDNVKTFSINLRTGVFKCLRASCGVTGNMITLSKDFDFSLGNNVDEYYRPKKQYEGSEKLRKIKDPITPKPEAIAYLESRGISERVAKEYEITTHPKDKKTIVFPFRDEKGVMQFAKYRKIDFDKSKGERKEKCERNCKPILFGMKQCKDFKRLTVCEGQIDSLSVSEAGIDNAVSVPNGANGFTWVPYCWNWINQFEEIVVFGDYEKGRITLLDELSRRLKTAIKHVREEDYKDCKDANDILRRYGKEQVRYCVENAVAVPLKRVIDLADVEDVDIFKIPKLETGIKQLDRLLYGGLPFGGVVLVSGKPGHGKSTFASQILVNALYQGYKCFAYSGELRNDIFRSWLDFQIVGGNHVLECSNKWGDSMYRISETNKAIVKEWYRGRFKLYDNRMIDDDEKESLIKTTEDAILQYGVNVVMLDNLMTALDLEATEHAFDKYDRQSLFVKKLSRLALKYNVLILLVAHKRKNNFSANENDEISGSGDISNLATVTLAYEKGKDLQDNQRLLKVSKNRLFGKLETDGYILEYDPKSKRIYGQGDNLYVDYGWNKESNGFSDINEEVPFEELEGIE